MTAFAALNSSAILPSVAKESAAAIRQSASKGKSSMTVRIEKNGAVWTVIHDRPEARNAMDPASAETLTAAFLEFDADDSAAVAVFYGAGGAFCAGWDLKYVSTLDVEHPLGELDIPTAGPRGNGGEIPRGPMGPSRLELDKPVIAAIEGPAVAGGMELGLWCDFRVMAENSYFGVYCRRWGVPLIDGGTVRLPRIVGQGRALEIILTGRKVPAEECLSIGLCEYVTPKGGARAKARGAGAADCALSAGLRARRSTLGDQEPRPDRARGADSGMVQRPPRADRGRRRRRDPLQGRPRPPRRLRKDPLSGGESPHVTRVGIGMRLGGPRHG